MCNWITLSYTWNYQHCSTIFQCEIKIKNKKQNNFKLQNVEIEIWSVKEKSIGKSGENSLDVKNIRSLSFFISHKYVEFLDSKGMAG